MKGLTLKHLRYFEALAAQGHFGRAAEVSAISQPALSMQIKELEDILGAPLFERSARKVRLTGFGKQFATRVREILRAVDELGDLARSAGTGFSGLLRLGIIPTVAPYLLPRVIDAVARAYPELDLQVRETRTATLLDELAEGRLDTAIVALPISEPTVFEMPLFSEEFVLVRPERDAGAPVPDGEGLRQMRLLLLEEGHCFRDQALSFCQVQTGLPRDGLDGSSLSTLVQMVSAGMGVTVIPEMAVPVETPSAQVDVCRFAAPCPERMIGMIWRKSTPMVAQLTALGELVRAAGVAARD